MVTTREGFVLGTLSSARTEGELPGVGPLDWEGSVR